MKLLTTTIRKECETKIVLQSTIIDTKTINLYVKPSRTKN